MLTDLPQAPEPHFSLASPVFPDMSEAACMQETIELREALQSRYIDTVRTVVGRAVATAKGLGRVRAVRIGEGRDAALLVQVEGEANDLRLPLDAVKVEPTLEVAFNWLNANVGSVESFEVTAVVP